MSRRTWVAPMLTWSGPSSPPGGQIANLRSIQSDLDPKYIEHDFIFRLYRKAALLCSFICLEMHMCNLYIEPRAGGFSSTSLDTASRVLVV